MGQPIGDGVHKINGLLFSICSPHNFVGAVFAQGAQSCIWSYYGLNMHEHNVSAEICKHDTMRQTDEEMHYSTYHLHLKCNKLTTDFRLW